MSIASEIVRLGTLRDTIRDKLIAAGIISNTSAKLDECATAIDGMTVNSKVSKVLDTSTTSVAIPIGYHKEVGTVSILAQEKTQAITSGSVIVTPDSGKVLKKVTVNGPTSYADTTQFASAITQDDENTYFSIPNAGWYNTESKIAAKNSNLSNVYFLGTGTNFNVSDIPGYQNLTADNFIVCSTSCSGSAVEFHSCGATAAHAKTYNADTGILSITGGSARATGSGSSSTCVLTLTLSAPQVYLVRGTIESH